MNWAEKTKRLLDIPAKSLRPIDGMATVRQEGEAAWVADLRTGENGAASLRVDVCGDSVVRIRLARGAIENRVTPMVVAPLSDRPPTTCRVNDDEAAWTLTTPLVLLRIARQPWGVTLEDRCGRVLLQADSDDRTAFSGPHVSPPAGFVDDADLPRIVATFKISPDEAFYGLGERFAPLDHRGRVVPCFTEGSGTWTQGTHKPIPFFMSSEGYGLFVNSSRPSLFDMGARSNATYSIALADDLLDLYVIYGPTFKQVLTHYAALTGRPEMPPKWSLGVWMSRHTYESQAQVEAVADRLRAEATPCDVIKLDTGWFHRPGRGSIIDHDMEWSDTFPAPAEMAAKLHAQGFRLCVWINLWFLTGSPKAQEARRLGFLLRRKDGTEFTFDMGSGCMVVPIDITLEAAREWYKGQLKVLLRQGVDTFFCDWGVGSDTELVYAGADGLSYNNEHGLLFVRTAHEAIREHTGRPGVVWALCGFAGIQRYPASYAGDSRCTFRDMASVLRGGLSASMSGISLWGAEIGGFGRLDSAPPEPELYIRYLQHGFLLPYAEFHGIGPREPWNFGDRAVAAYKKFASVRYRLLPYLYSQTALACSTGIPVLRPMVLEFQDDPNARHLDLQYMLGDAFLVAPVFGSETQRRVYLPAGTWFDFWTDEAHAGPGWIDCAAPLDRLPLFVRGNSIIPFGPDVQCTDDGGDVPPVFHVYGSAGGTGIWFDGNALHAVTAERREGRLQLSLDGVSRADHQVVVHGGE
ncbi:MAG TPA: TIM-barrel domain-containing protein [Tepidisphaeraceae bacterium]|nr:TIM-barrel domain-containing protein [Tepidisphaeraceae bacterium]